VPSFEQLAFSVQAERIQEIFFQRGTVPAPLVSFTPQTQEQDGLVITVAPVLPESEPWNAWPDGTARLFNDSMGFLWSVRIVSDRPAHWIPAATQLAVNDSDQVFSAVTEPDEVLGHLVQGAALETRAGAPANLSLRARNADDFRHAYLGTDPRAGTRDGVLLFPAPTRQIQTVAMELTLAVAVEGLGVREYHFLFE
jgi:hypothetical protein